MQLTFAFANLNQVCQGGLVQAHKVLPYQIEKGRFGTVAWHRHFDYNVYFLLYTY